MNIEYVSLSEDIPSDMIWFNIWFHMIIMVVYHPLNCLNFESGAGDARTATTDWTTGNWDVSNWETNSWKTNFVVDLLLPSALGNHQRAQTTCGWLWDICLWAKNKGINMVKRPGPSDLQGRWGTWCVKAKCWHIRHVIIHETFHISSVPIPTI
jgi:hypothetical protein